MYEFLECIKRTQVKLPSRYAVIILLPPCIPWRRMGQWLYCSAHS